MNDKIALITGGTGGIGTAICRELTRQGHQVVAVYYPPQKDEAESWRAREAAQGFAFNIIGADVAAASSSARMVEEVQKNHGTISVLVNCAGITRDGTLSKMPLENWEAVIDTNLNSAYYVTKPVFAAMAEQGFGRIINIASVNGQKGQFGQANYSAAKAGLHGFTMAVAQEGARKGVTVNTVSPGYVETPMTQAIDAQILESIVSQVPMGRMAKPEEIASIVGWLAEERNGYITGANIPVNGGMYMSA